MTDGEMLGKQMPRMDLSSPMRRKKKTYLAP
jgi:hypothetical protein